MLQSRAFIPYFTVWTSESRRPQKYSENTTEREKEMESGMMLLFDDFLDMTAFGHVRHVKALLNNSKQHNVCTGFPSAQLHTPTPASQPH